MKTYNNKNITKKHIVSVLRTLDSTQIFKLVHMIYGGKPTKSQVYNFITAFAPTNKVFDNAYNIVYYSQHQILPVYNRNLLEFKKVNGKALAIKYLKEQIKDVTSHYAKRPMLGYTHLYFCSPVYGHTDYNKWQSVPIQGNEHFCETIIAYADKFFAPVYDK